MIEVNNLVKRYGDHTAVDHLSFKIEKGKIYGFLGPNGAGKSTTMNMITGYIASTEGTVTIDGHDILVFYLKKDVTPGKHTRQDVLFTLSPRITSFLDSYINIFLI